MSTRPDPTAAAPDAAVASTVATAPADTTAVVARLSTVDRFLPVWIGAAMVAGLLLGRLVPGLDDALDAVKVGQTSLPIAIGLIWNDLACGDREMAAVLVALNAIFQVLTYAALGYFYLKVLPGWLGLETTDLDLSLIHI